MRQRSGAKWNPPVPAQPGCTETGKAAKAADLEKTAKSAEQNAMAEAEMRKRKPNKFENAFMIDMMILRNSLAVRREAVRERLSEVNPHAWRDLQLMYSLVCRVQEQLMETMPESRKDYYATLARSGRYHLDIQGPIRQERTVLISDKNLGVILDAVLESECLMCLKDGSEIEKCPIRRALLEVGPPTEIIENGIGCEYRDVPGQLIRGEIVTV